MGFVTVVICIVIIWYLVSSNSGKAVSPQKTSEKTQLELQKEESEKNLWRDLQRKEFRKKFDTGFVQATSDQYPKYIFIDFETTDLPPEYLLPKSDELDMYPYIVQAGILVFNESKELIDEFSSIIKVPLTARFSPDSVRIHGISKERSINDGVEIGEMLQFFKRYVAGSTTVIAHNVKFDDLLLKTEAKRNGVRLSRYKKYCTMKSTVDICKIWKYNYSSYKYPKLSELVEHTFFNGEHIPNALNFHDAATDIKLCAMCFFELKLFEDLVEEISN